MRCRSQQRHHSRGVHKALASRRLIRSGEKNTKAIKIVSVIFQVQCYIRNKTLDTQPKTMKRLGNITNLVKYPKH